MTMKLRGKRVSPKVRERLWGNGKNMIFSIGCSQPTKLRTDNRRIPAVQIAVLQSLSRQPTSVQKAWGLWEREWVWQNNVAVQITSVPLHVWATCWWPECQHQPLFTKDRKDRRGWVSYFPVFPVSSLEAKELLRIGYPYWLNLLVCYALLGHGNT